MKLQIRGWFRSLVLVSHLACETLDLGHVHPAPYIAQVHVPEEPASTTLPNAKSVPAAATGRTLEVFTGREPSSLTDPDSGVWLATLNAFASIEPDNLWRVWATGTAKASGTAGHFRVKDEGGRVVFQGDITTSGGGGYVTFDNTTVVAGGMMMIAYSPDPN